MFEGLTFKIAEGSEREGAQDMARHVYITDLGRAIDDGFDEGADFLIALVETGDIVATSRIVRPEQRPFDLETFVDLSGFLLPGRVPALVGRMTVRHDLRTMSRQIFIQVGLLKLAYSFAQKQGITDFVLYTFPHLVAFYRSALFEPKQTFRHPDWGPVHVMHLDLVNLEGRCVRSRHRLARLLFSPDLPNIEA